MPNLEVVQRWAAETPESFRFCFKIPREISHSGHLARKTGETLAFVERMSGLGERLGPFFLQLPASYGPAQIDDLARWLVDWPAGYQVAVEVRHDDWYAAPGEADLMRLLEQRGAGRVLMDVRPLSAGPLPGAEENLQRARDNKPDAPLHPLCSSNFALVRYIGHPDLDLNAPLLDEWAARVALPCRAAFARALSGLSGATGASSRCAAAAVGFVRARHGATNTVLKSGTVVDTESGPGQSCHRVQFGT